MKRITAIAIVFIVICGLVLNGCGGSTKAEIKQAPQTTLGQELLDLDKAHKAGIITDKEYEKKKKDIMKRYEE